jgi:endonuclease/exonuclease/phosphatase (EEP) superfamily protein YafD
MAFFPYIVVATAVILLALLALRSRWLILAAAGLVAVELVLLIPRFVSHNPGVPAGTPRLRIATSNTHRGHVDMRALVELVRSKRVDVLTVQELTPERIGALDAAGMRELMPYRELHPEIDSSIYSRLPLSGGGLLNQPTDWPQVTADISVGGRSIRLVAVHTYYPVGDPRRWTKDMAALRTEAGRAGKDVVFLGDFNATLDHAPMRALLAAGLTDTHAELGRWAPTWPADRTLLPPLIQLDHVLHGGGLSAVSVSEHKIAGTDHRAVVAELALLS